MENVLSQGLTRLDPTSVSISLASGGGKKRDPGNKVGLGKVNPGSLSECKLGHDESVNQISIFAVDDVTEHTWTALFLECLVDQHKVYHYRACRVLRVGEHIELLHAMFLVLFLGINRRKLQLVLSCPFFCQQ